MIKSSEISIVKSIVKYTSNTITASLYREKNLEDAGGT